MCAPIATYKGRADARQIVRTIVDNHCSHACNLRTLRVLKRRLLVSPQARLTIKSRAYALAKSAKVPVARMNCHLQEHARPICEGNDHWPFTELVITSTQRGSPP